MWLESKEDGFGLVEMIIAVGLTAVLLTFASSLFLNSQRALLHNDQRLGLQQISRHLVQKVDCTSAPTPCPIGTHIDLFDRDSNILVSRSSSTKIGLWSIQARCAHSNLIEIRTAKRNKDNNGYAVDPITNVVLDFDHSNAVLFPPGSLCSSGSSQSTTTTKSELVLGSSCLVTSPNQLPCNPETPAPCAPGYNSVAMSLDTFGGNNDPGRVGLFGQRLIRYCQKIK